MSTTKPRGFAEKLRRLKACVTDDPETIRKLSKDPSGWVREALLYNPKTSSDALLSIAQKASYMQHAHISMHPNVDANVLSYLARYPQIWSAGRDIVNHPETPFGTWVAMQLFQLHPNDLYAFKLRKLP